MKKVAIRILFFASSFPLFASKLDIKNLPCSVLMAALPSLTNEYRHLVTEIMTEYRGMYVDGDRYTVGSLTLTELLEAARKISEVERQALIRLIYSQQARRRNYYHETEFLMALGDEKAWFKKLDDASKVFMDGNEIFASYESAQKLDPEIRERLINFILEKLKKASKVNPAIMEFAPRRSLENYLRILLRLDYRFYATYRETGDAWHAHDAVYMEVRRHLNENFHPISHEDLAKVLNLTQQTLNEVAGEDYATVTLIGSLTNALFDLETSDVDFNYVKLPENFDQETFRRKLSERLTRYFAGRRKNLAPIQVSLMDPEIVAGLKAPKVNSPFQFEISSDGKILNVYPYPIIRHQLELYDLGEYPRMEVGSPTPYPLP